MLYNKSFYVRIFLITGVLLCTESFAHETIVDDIEINVGSSKSLINDSEKWYAFQGCLEIGFIDVISHNIQFGENGTKFDYVKEGGQDIFFRFSRLSAELQLGKRHALILLFQPLDIQTEALLNRDIVIDDLIFPQDTPLKLRYGFDFWRLSYLYDFCKKPEREFAIGISFQIRNASISFRSYDGTLFRINQNVGPVPIFKCRIRIPFNYGMWFGSEIDGFYASGKYITGSENDFVGAILDASLCLGFELNKSFETFLNVRYLGGGARGTQEDNPGPGDGYTDNWLHTLAISLGTYIK